MSSTMQPSDTDNRPRTAQQTSLDPSQFHRSVLLMQIMESAKEDLTKTAQKLRKSMIEAGMFDENGKVRKEYRGLFVALNETEAILIRELIMCTGIDGVKQTTASHPNVMKWIWRDTQERAHGKQVDQGAPPGSSPGAHQWSPPVAQVWAPQGSSLGAHQWSHPVAQGYPQEAPRHQSPYKGKGKPQWHEAQWSPPGSPRGSPQKSRQNTTVQPQPSDRNKTPSKGKVHGTPPVSQWSHQGYPQESSQGYSQGYPQGAQQGDQWSQSNQFTSAQFQLHKKMVKNAVKKEVGAMSKAFEKNMEELAILRGQQNTGAVATPDGYESGAYESDVAEGVEGGEKTF